MCQMRKSDNKIKAKLYQPMKISSRKWAHISEPNRFMAIVAFVDKLTKMVHLIGWKKEVTTMEYA